MAFLFPLSSIVSASILISSSYAAFFNSSVGPVALCGRKPLNIEATLSECYERCRRSPQPTSTARLNLYKTTAKGGGPNVVECKRVKLKQSFTETWTFSTSKSMLVKEEELASESECKEAMNKHCPKYDCDVRPPRQLSEEYSYASEITKEETFISLLSMPSTYLTVGSTLYLMPLSSEDMFDYKKGQGYTTTSRYYWEVGQEMKECPFEEVGSNYGCDFFGKPIADAHWMCNRGGFSLTPLVNLSDALPACEGIVRSKEGLLYKVTDTTDKLNIWSQRIGMVGVAYKDAETD